LENVNIRIELHSGSVEAMVKLANHPQRAKGLHGLASFMQPE